MAVQMSCSCLISHITIEHGQGGELVIRLHRASTWLWQIGVVLRHKRAPVTGYHSLVIGAKERATPLDHGPS